jgi:DNA-binding response OmpR family regulator
MDSLLFIEDDQRLAGMVSDYLSQSGFQVTHAASAKDGLTQLHQDKSHDLVILDVMLPDSDGLEVCRRIRSMEGTRGQTPILMLTAKGDPLDRVVGLEIGADDYVAKPFEPRELLARIRAILRRQALSSRSLPPVAQSMRFGGLEIDRDSRTVRVQGQSVDLTSYQFDLLLALAERAGRVMSREQIVEVVRGREMEAYDRSIDVHIGRIRSAIEEDVKSPKRILTVRGVGYVFSRVQD